MKHQNQQHHNLQQLGDHSDRDLVDGIGRLHVATSRLPRELLSFIREYDRRRLWEEDGCRHMGQWLAGHLGVTVSEGLRWTTAAHALEYLPLISDAFERGVLSLDKVLQLVRFATVDTEKDLIRWATRASVTRSTTARLNSSTVPRSVEAVALSDRNRRATPGWVSPPSPICKRLEARVDSS